MAVGVRPASGEDQDLEPAWRAPVALALNVAAPYALLDAYGDESLAPSSSALGV